MFTLPDLPFDDDALAPRMSAETINCHYRGHHRAYVDKLNQLVADTEFENMPISDILLATQAMTQPGHAGIFRNAAQHWNHSFFWQCLAPDGGGTPSGSLSWLIERDFGSYHAFREEFCKQGIAHFGSGWLWLVLADDKLQILTTHDAAIPAGDGHEALLCCDLWEHAYYLDHQNRRPDFLDGFLAGLVNWPFAEKRLAGMGGDTPSRMPVGATDPTEHKIAPDPRRKFVSPEMLMASEQHSNEEKLALLNEWNLDLVNRLKAEEEGMSASDPMDGRQEARIADEAARVQSCISQLSGRVRNDSESQ